MFTDANLKRLKDCLGGEIGHTHETGECLYESMHGPDWISPLLARLEASEAALQELKGDAEETVLYARWRESCGR